MWHSAVAAACFRDSSEMVPRWFRDGSEVVLRGFRGGSERAPFRFILLCPFLAHGKLAPCSLLLVQIGRFCLQQMSLVCKQGRFLNEINTSLD